MLRKALYTLVAALVAFTAAADNWEQIVSSGDYYYGIGVGSTQEEADNNALNALSTSIATKVESRFKQLDDLTNVNGNIDHKSKVEMCIKTYTYSSLRGVKQIIREEKGKYHVLRYIPIADVAQIYEARKEIAQNMVAMGDHSLNDGYIDQALKNYSWALSLVRSLQCPEEVKNDNGEMLYVTLPLKIERILGDITVAYAGNDEDRVNLLFHYKDKPVQSLVFTFNNGTELEEDNHAKNGRGMILMRKGYENGPYHIDIEYKFRHLAERDDELRSVLDVVGSQTYKTAHKVVASTAPAKPKIEAEAGIHLQPTKSQQVEKKDDAQSVMEKVINAIANRSEMQLNLYFTPEGKLIYDKLLGYGRDGGRIVGTPDLKYFHGYDSTTVVRGLQMSFVTRLNGKNRTFVEDVVFTLNTDNKISNIAFGLGEKATNDILCRQNNWPDHAKELITEFMENYKTAFCLERLDYLQGVFSDDAQIIIGNVLRPFKEMAPLLGELPVNRQPQEQVVYHQYTKDRYMANLKRCFDRNEFINVQFGRTDVQWLNKLYKENGQEIYGINLRQEYVSTTYSDKGYLFLMIDMTNRDQPLIRKRTWQPNEVPVDKLINAGDFFDY